MNASEIPVNEPPEARAGLTWQWRREDLSDDYPASSWTLKYYLKQLGTGGAHIEITATADGDLFAVLVAASTTQGYTAGKYSWAAVVTGGSSEVYEVDRGVLNVLARYDQANALDDRSHARKMVDAIEALLENRATIDQQEYTIGARHLKRMTVEELTTWRDYYRSQVFQEDMVERARNGQGGNRFVVKL